MCRLSAPLAALHINSHGSHFVISGMKNVQLPFLSDRRSIKKVHSQALQSLWVADVDYLVITNVSGSIRVFRLR